MEKLYKYKNFKIKFEDKHYLIKNVDGKSIPKMIDGIPVICDVSIDKPVVYLKDDLKLSEIENQPYEIKLIDDKYVINGIINNKEKIMVPAKIDDINVELGNNCFNGIKADEVTIEEGIEKIPYRCFCNSKINTVKLPKSLIEIDEAAFWGSSVKNINLENVEIIKHSAFTECQIKEANLKNLKTAQASVFIDCKQLNKINISDKLDFLPFNFFKNTCIETIDLKNITEIGSFAFSNCYDLKTVKGDKLKTINADAFQFCEQLSSINLSKVKSIKDEAFYNCVSLKDITFNDDIQMNYFAFSFSNIENLTCNKKLTCEMSVFSGANINKLTLNGFTEFDKQVFNNAVINNLIINDELKIINKSLHNATINNLEIHGTVTMDKGLGDDFSLNNIVVNNFTKNKYPDWTVNEKTTYKELSDKGFSTTQINQILRAQNNNILMSSISPNTPSNIIHALIDLKEKNLALTSKILKMCNKELTLEQEIEINKLITNYNQENDKKNIDVNIER